ncbi:MAG: 1-phosphofructokinase [Propionibacteriaceae bacterium]|jgi:1-phosphofructokinase|nr:1-phosphofructokinase [Propionibacteriaceae bacterium]
MIHTVTFSPSLDYVMDVAEIEAGAINRSAGEQIFPGGKGVNIAIVLGRFGVPCRALGFSAGLTGQSLRSLLLGLGVHTDFIELPAGETRINVKLATRPETAINGQGPAIPTSALNRLFAKLGELQRGDTLALAGAVPDSLSDDIYETIMARLKPRGVRLVVDATGDLLRKTLPHRPFLIKPNGEELGALFGATIDSPESAARYAAAAQRLGARHVLVSLGGQGAVLVTEDGSALRGRVPAGQLVNSVGAGDSVVAGFLAGLQATDDLSHAFQLGLAAGSAAAFNSWLPSRPAIEKLYPHVTITELETPS